MRLVAVMAGILYVVAPGVRAADLPPGECPGDVVESLRAALARSDAGQGAAADLDLAACYRALDQEVPESAALGRTLDSGTLDESDAGLVRARLEAIGWPPPPRDAGEAALGEAAGAEPTSAGSAQGETASTDPLWAYTLAGVAVVSLLAATAAGFVALDEEASGGDAATPGIVAAACAAAGVAAAVAALVLWPDDERPGPRPRAGPGDVGLGIEFRF